MQNKPGKTIIALITIIFITTLFSGCVPYSELDKKAIVEAMGIDLENEKYTVTIQYFNMDESGGATIVDTTKPNVIVVDGSGSSISDALEDVSYKCGRQLMFGITGFIVLGKKAAENDIWETLSFAVSHFESNPKSLVAVSEGKASDIMQVKFKEDNDSAKKIEGLFENAEKQGLCEPLRLYEVLDKLCQPTKSLVLPLIKAEEDGGDFTDDGKTITLSGGALICDGKLKDSLDVRLMSGVQILSGNAETAQLTVKSDGKEAAVMLFAPKTKITPNYNDGKLSFYIEIKADGKYVNGNFSNPLNSREKLGTICSEMIKSRVEDAVNKVMVNYGADVSGIKYEISSKDYFLWLKVSENFSRQLKNAEYTVSCDINIQRFGMTRG